MTVTSLTLLLFLTTISGQQQPKLSVYVPKNMPVILDVTRDKVETSLTKYRIKPSSAGSISVTITIALVGSNGEILSESSDRTLFNDKRPWTEISWAKQVDVRHLVVIVEELEAKQGIWKADNLKLNEVIRSGGVPSARLIVRGPEKPNDPFDRE